jgi:hypothetical protein
MFLPRLKKTRSKAENRRELASSRFHIIERALAIWECREQALILRQKVPAWAAV